MSFSFLGGLAGLLPGYLQGQRMANQDNWQDLMNYNQAQSGQLSNMFTGATWQPRINMFRNEWLNSDMNTAGNMMNLRANMLLQPWKEMMASAQTYYAPLTAPIGPESLIRMDEYIRKNPQYSLYGLLGGGAGRAPSGALGG